MYQTIELPSRCRVYTGVDPSTIKARTLLGKDEKLIAEIPPENYERKFHQLLADVLQGIPIEKMTLGDRKYLILWLAINSYSKDFPIKFNCENCLAKLSMTVDLSKMLVKNLPDDFVEPQKVTLTKELDVNLKLLRVEDELRILDLQKAGQNIWLHRFAQSIVDDTKTHMEKVEWLEQLPAKLVAKIRAFHDVFDHGPIMTSDYECEKCGGAGLVPVPFRLEMLFPSGDDLKRYYGASM